MSRKSQSAGNLAGRAGSELRGSAQSLAWRNAHRDPAEWHLIGPGGKLLAAVVCQDDGSWRWDRFTTIGEQGLPPASGREPSRRWAQRRAAGSLGTTAKVTPAK
jgi:hypothetical protein